MCLRVSLVALLVGVASCGGTDAPTQPTPPGGGTPVITIVEPLTPGQTSVLRGTHLREVARLTVDGKEAVITATTDAELHFSVPAMRACETDGRGVEVVANGVVRATGRIAAPGLVALEVGQSRVLGAAELGCVSLRASAAAYVLSMHNFSRQPVVEPYFRLRSYTVSADTTASAPPSFQSVPVPGTRWREQHSMPLVRATPSNHASHTGVLPAAFDPRYATATIGDTLVFVDWTKPEALTAGSRAEVPSYRSLVVAVAGAQVVVLDLRTAGASEMLANAPVRDRLQRAAAIADRYTLPAVRAVIDAEAAFPLGAGERVFTVVGDLPAGVAGGITTADLLGASYSRWTSDIGLVNLSAAFVREQSVRGEQLAATIIHENGHLADVVAARRRGVAGSTGWFSEALAVSVEERAARIAVGRELNVTVAEAQRDGVPAAAMRMPDGMSHLYSPWAGGVGAYVRGPRLALYAMEHLGEVGFAPSRNSLYQRLLAGSAPPETLPSVARERIWGIDAIARAAGMTAEELMERSTLAELTDDLVAPAAASALALPQFRTWNNALQSTGDLRSRVSSAHWLPLDEARVGEVTVPGGSHHYFYITTEPTRGLSIAASQVRLQDHHKVRVTRLW
jgi:hypothetical protein